MRNPIAHLTLAATLATLLLTGGRLISQTQPLVAKSPEQRLAELKAANAELLKKQATTQERLDALLKDAEQLRIFAKRS